MEHLKDGIWGRCSEGSAYVEWWRPLNTVMAVSYSKLDSSDSMFRPIKWSKKGRALFALTRFRSKCSTWNTLPELDCWASGSGYYWGPGEDGEFPRATDE